jgi:hypothetical protein
VPSNTTIDYLIRSIGPQIPLLILYVVVIVLALTRRERHRVSATYALAGAAVLLVQTIANSIIWVVLVTSPMRSSNIGTWYMTLAVVNGLMHAVGIGLIAAGVFAGRGESAVYAAFPVATVAGGAPPPPLPNAGGFGSKA